MPLLDIAISQPCSCSCNNVLALGFETRFHRKFVIENDRRLASVFPWRTYRTTKRVGTSIKLGRFEVCRGGLTIKAVATLEVARVDYKNEEVNHFQNLLRMDVNSVESSSIVCELQASVEGSTEVDEREMLRRIRISKANMGNTPWNKGKKHSPETLQRIKERTRIAMQDPKVKMKLVNFGHAQSEETKIKIGVGVRLGWERRRAKLMLQETCHQDWQNLIATASRKGLLGQEELEWDSYKVLNEQHEKERIQSVEQRKKMLKPKGSKRAPKSAEQKRKIAEAIAAKWADPDYRERVCSGLAKFHGIAEGVERKIKRKQCVDGQTRKTSPKKKVENALAKCQTKSQKVQSKSTKNKTPLYKDPFANSKLEMLKNIRAQRVAALKEKGEAISRAKSLILEAEKAANALEIAAKHSPFAQASLSESRALISEAMQCIRTVESEDSVSFDLAESATEPVHHSEEQVSTIVHNLDDGNPMKINGVQSLLSSDFEADDFRFSAFFLPISCHDDSLETEENPQMRSNGFLLHEPTDNINQPNLTKNLADQKPSPNGTVYHRQIPLFNGVKKKSQSVRQDASENQVKITKKWVCGRLIEVEET